MAIAGTGTQKPLALTSLLDGQHGIDVRAKDAAGNSSTISTYQWTIDTVSPTVSLTSKPAAQTNQSTASFGFSSSKTATFQYSLDGGSWVSITGSSLSLSSLSESNHQIDVKATDTLGNVSTATSYTWTTDYTSPVATIASNLATQKTNQSTVSFTFSSTKTATFQYSLDGGLSWVSITGSSLDLSGLSAGNHQVDIKATDTVGNVSSVANYAWQTDYTAPTVSITQVASPGGTTTGNMKVNFTSSKEATYSYKIDAGAWTSTDTPLNLTGLGTGSRTFYYKATDLFGNVSPENQLSFTLNRYSFTGTGNNVKGDGGGITGNATLEIAGINGQNWGGWNTSYALTGTPGTSWSLAAGGSDASSYWLETATVSTSGNALSGTSDLTYLSTTKLGEGVSGSLTGTTIGSPWNATIDGTGKYTESDLTFVNTLSADLAYFNGTISSNDGSVGSAYMGGTSSIWTATQASPSSVTAIGQYTAGTNPVHVWDSDMKSYNYTNSTNTTYDGGAYWGYIKGTESSNSLEGKLAAIYIDPSGKAGYLTGSLAGTGYDGDVKMFKMTGSLYPTQMATAAEIGGILPSALSANVSQTTYSPDVIVGFSGGFTGAGGGTINIGTVRDGGNVYTAGITGQDWGVWKSYIGSTYAGTISDTWQMSMDFALPVTPSWTSIIGTEIAGSKWSDGKIAGLAAGYGADIQATPKTWISAGETLGTFKPANFTLQISSVGPWIETTKFLAMQGGATTDAGANAALKALNIPCVQVGSANLTGSATYATGAETMYVTMNNTRFFATTSGGPAKIWASESAGGSYTGVGYGPPPSGTSATLSSGTGLGATFTVTTFDTGTSKWLATVTNGTIASGYGGSTTFRGAAAGTINTGAKTFSGTAAGVAK